MRGVQKYLNYFSERLVFGRVRFCHDGIYIVHSEPAFLAPFEKTERTKTQIRDLDLAIKSFFKHTPYEIVRELYLEAKEEVWGFNIPKRIPGEISVRVGEILQNLRSSLDQMLAELVSKVSNRSEAGVEFPFGRDIDEFESALRKQKKLPSAAIPLIRALQPYKGGDPLLWLLHSANRRDKHRTGLIPIQVNSTKTVSYLVVWYGFVLVIGSRSGQNLAQKNRPTNEQYVRLALEGRPWGIYGTMKQDPRTGRPLAPWANPTITSKMAVPGHAEKGMEFLTTTPGTKFETDFQAAFDVALRDAGSLESEPVVHVLSQLRDLVERILLTFKRRFFP